MRIDVVAFEEAASDPEIMRAWGEYIVASSRANALQGSPEWARHLSLLGTDVRVAIVRDSTSRVVGLLPVARHPFALTFDLGARTLAKTEFAAVVALGSVPMIRDDESLRIALVRSLFSAFSDCDALLFDVLSDGDGFWKLAGRARPEFVPYRPRFTRRAYVLQIDGSFEEYLGGLSSKFRYNVERSLRTLRAAGRGRLDLVRCRSPSEVDAFFDEAVSVRRKSWQHASVGDLDDDPLTSRRALVELARTRLLRSYVLRAGEAPCAFAIGYEFRGVYHYAAAGYDAAYSRHSPGTVLLYLLLRDLFAAERPRMVWLGTGEEAYKSRFGATEQAARRAFYFRPTLRNSARVLAHRLFTNLKQSARGSRSTEEGPRDLAGERP